MHLRFHKIFFELSNRAGKFQKYYTIVFKYLRKYRKILHASTNVTINLGFNDYCIVFILYSFRHKNRVEEPSSFPYHK